MKTHRITVLDEFADEIFNGDKPFEVRENDRGYQKGEHIVFKVVSKNPYKNCNGHPLNDKEYEITYVLSGWGMKNGYVAFGIRSID